MTTEKLTTYKGFDIGFKCRGYQFTMGATHTHEGDVKACCSGFHSCKSPLEVFNYYAPGASVYARTEASGTLSQELSGDSKVASSELTVTAQVTIADLASAHIQFVKSNLIADANPQAHATGDRSAASNTGDRSAASNTGNRSAASNTGYQSAASNTGYRSAASNTGYQSAASNTGN